MNLSGKLPIYNRETTSSRSTMSMPPTKKQKDRNSRIHQGTPQQHGASKTPAPAHSETDIATLQVEVQQIILDVFRRAFSFDSDQLDLKATIQEVKGYLFQRDFSRAFANAEYLDAYALRWSASRALGYSSIFTHGDLQQIWSRFDVSATSAVAVLPASLSSPDSPRSHASAHRVLCIGGGGGAEVAACAAAVRKFHPSSTKLSVHVVDIANWAACLQKLENALCTPPQLSTYASESAKAANKAFIPCDSFDVYFAQRDILSVDQADLRDMMQHAFLCTIMFTLNELFSVSIAKTTAFLLALTESMIPASWLLVVDSPGSYSEVKLGTGEDPKTRQYPMKWLLDHTLLEVAGEGNNRRWKKAVSDDSRWFRLNQHALKYPIELENMRYQIHLYQRIDGEG